MYTKLLIQSSKSKAALSVLLIFFLAVVLGAMVSDFLADPEGLPLIFIVGVSQVAFIAQYFIIRLIWKTQLLSIRDDDFYRFFIDKSDVTRLVDAKLSVLIHILILHVLTAYAAFFFSSGISADFVVFSAIEWLGLSITLFVFSLDFMNVNRVWKSYSKVVITIAVLSFIGLFYYPNYLTFGIVAGEIMLIAIIGLPLIRGGKYAEY